MNGESLETVEKFCYPGDKVRARAGAVESVIITRIRSGWCKFTDLVPLIIFCMCT